MLRLLTHLSQDYVFTRSKRLAISPERTSWSTLAMELEVTDTLYPLYERCYSIFGQEETKTMPSYENIWNTNTENDKGETTRRKKVLRAAIKARVRNATNQLRDGVRLSIMPSCTLSLKCL